MNFFNSLRVDLTPELERYVDEILENILSQRFVTSPVSNLSRSSSSALISNRFRSTNCRFSVLSIVTVERGQRNGEFDDVPVAAAESQPPATVHRSKRRVAADFSNDVESIGNARHLENQCAVVVEPDDDVRLGEHDERNGSMVDRFPHHSLDAIGSNGTGEFRKLHSFARRADEHRQPLPISLQRRFQRFPSGIISATLVHSQSKISFSSFYFIDLNSQRLLALLNENHDELVQAALACLKDYAHHLQRRIKILRDPSCFCPNLQLGSGQCDTNEFVHDEFNNTMNSARSVSSINSATSNGYRNPSQW